MLSKYKFITYIIVFFVTIVFITNAFCKNSQDNESISQSSGFIIDERGYIVTANDFIDKLSSIEVVYNSFVYEAKIIANDATAGLALLKIEFRGFDRGAFPVLLMDDSQLHPCDSIRIVSCSIVGEIKKGWFSNIIRGISNSVNQGNIYSINEESLLLSATVNLGSGGSPIINNNGRVIGMLKSQNSERVVEGIPVNRLMSFLDKSCIAPSCGYKVSNDADVNIDLVMKATVFIKATTKYQDAYLPNPCAIPGVCGK
ncbi:MAG: trypsin-like peptidase domain-containing protein [Nitrospirae bacterium]|nr:trypsin-like peptidase domain-containing protein [Nitrospirota bacterium]